MQKTIRPIRTGEEYIESLRGRDLTIYLFGELVKEPVDHPMIRPSINAVAKRSEERREGKGGRSRWSP